MKTSLHGGASLAGADGALCCALWLGFLLVAHRRIRALAGADRPPPLAPRHATAAALCTMALAACAAVLVVY